MPVGIVPTVTIFVRHSLDCPRMGDEFAKNCKCVKHLRWSYGGKQYRQSAHTRSWASAETSKRQVEERFKVSDPTTAVESIPASRPTIDRAVELFTSDKKSQGLEGGVLKKYERELERFNQFMAKRSRHFPDEIRLEDLTEFRSGWTDQYPSSTTRQKVQERLRGFLRYCYESKMIDRVPKLSAIKVDEPPTLPLSEKQYQALLKAASTEFPGTKGTRAHALIRLIRFTGLAIRDCVTLEREELKRDGRNGLYRVVTNRQKTGTHVSVPIPLDVAEEVIAAMKLNDNPKYIFWNTGTGKEQTAVTNWQHDLRQLFRAAGQPDGHPHQLRDTFAVGLLEKGVPLEEVSKLLGHDSIKTTEKHYAKWVKGRQDRLDKLVIGTWAKPKTRRRA